MADLASVFAAEGGIFAGALRPIAAFAGGGIVRRPTVAMVGEGGGPEAVIPLKGGAVPVDLNLGGSGEGGSRTAPTGKTKCHWTRFLQ